MEGEELGQRRRRRGKRSRCCLLLLLLPGPLPGGRRGRSCCGCSSGGCRELSFLLLPQLRQKDHLAEVDGRTLLLPDWSSGGGGPSRQRRLRRRCCRYRRRPRCRRRRRRAFSSTGDARLQVARGLLPARLEPVPELQQGLLFLCDGRRGREVDVLLLLLLLFGGRRRRRLKKKVSVNKRWASSKLVLVSSFSLSLHRQNSPGRALEAEQRRHPRHRSLR